MTNICFAYPVFTDNDAEFDEEKISLGCYVKISPNFMENTILDKDIVLNTNIIYEKDELNMFIEEVNRFFEYAIKDAISNDQYWSERNDESFWTFTSFTPKEGLVGLYPYLRILPKCTDTESLGRPFGFSIKKSFENEDGCKDFEKMVNSYMNAMVDSYQIAVGMEPGYNYINRNLGSTIWSFD